MTDITRYRARFLVLFALLTVPFLRMLIEHSYGWFHVEILVAVLFIATAAAVLAAIACTPSAFHLLTVGSAVLLSVNTVHVNFFPLTPLSWIMAGLTGLLLCAVLVLGKNFYQILLIFLLGTSLGDIANVAVDYTDGLSFAQAKRANYDHVVHIILDEMMSLSAMPPECGECIRGAAAFQQTLERGNFQIYPYAFSNYQATHDSIPSILNGHILDRTEEYLPTEKVDRPFLHENRYFEKYLARKYAIRVYQSDDILFDSTEYGSVQARTYKANNLSALHEMHISWLARLKQLSLVYIRSDRFWSRLCSELVGFHHQPQRIGPLAAKYVWPDRLLEDFGAATQNTLFFVHLLSPHSPYVYRSDGSVRSLADANSPDNHCGWCWETSKYQQSYRLYGEQVQFLAGQINRFLDGLKQTGLYDSTTIIIHGDHGSRLRLLTLTAQQLERIRIESAGFWVSRYDYIDEPELRDLLNRFSTLLAIKLPRSGPPRMVTETGSVLYFLERVFGPWSQPKEYAAVNSVYLFNADGSPRRIPVLDLWRKAGQAIVTNVPVEE